MSGIELVKWAGAALVTLVLVYGALAAFGARRWSRASRALITRLDTGRTLPAKARYNEAELAGLPARYSAISGPF